MKQLLDGGDQQKSCRCVQKTLHHDQGIIFQLMKSQLMCQRNHQRKKYASTRLLG